MKVVWNDETGWNKKLNSGKYKQRVWNNIRQIGENKENSRTGLSLPGARLTLGTIDITVISKNKLAYVRSK